jgi:flagellar M-ring protein FliF
VVVNQLKFDDTAAKEAKKELTQAAKAKSQAGKMSLAKTGGVLLLVAIALLLVLRSARKGPKRMPIALPSDLTELGPPRNALAANSVSVNEDERVLVGASVGGSSFDSIATRDLPIAAVAQSDIVQLIERQPDEVAQLLRSWLADRRD